ncbi:caspase domain-containing protein [Streptomyces sioyaensis]|uniref:caspase domain-containing protein n=1 Tax=Streptomyces sioyaensis TaxID=67364 RepID=UPI0037B1E398
MAITGEPVPFDPARSRAVLIGCSTYHPHLKQEGLGDLPSVPHSLDAMRDLLDQWGMPSRNCDTVSDRNGPLTTDTIREALRNAALRPKERSDLLLVYFSGHGYTIEPADGQGLYLALSKTESVRDNHGSLAFSLIANILQDPAVQADHIMVILDCCHAGAAVSHVRPVLQPPGETGVSIALLVAADKGWKAKSPTEDGPSFFTGAFIAAAGQPAPRSGSHLSLSDLAQSVKQQAEQHNEGLRLPDLHERVPIPLTLHGHVADHPWLPNKAHPTPGSAELSLPCTAPAQVAAEKGAASEAVAPSEENGAASEAAPPSEASGAAAEAAPVVEKAAPFGLKWPWDYPSPLRPVLPRPEEFGQLQTRSRPGNVVPITGEPGVGKKCLTEMFVRERDGSRAVMPSDPYVLRLDLDLIRYKSPVPALRALQFTLGLDRYRNGGTPQDSLDFAELREQAVAQLARRVGGRPLVVYITLRTPRSGRRKIHDDLERLLAYPVFRDAIVLVVSARDLEGLTGAGQLLPSAPVNVPPLSLDQCAELLRLLLEEREITGVDPAAALRLSGDESIAFRPTVLTQAVAALGLRLTAGGTTAHDGMLAEEIRRATHYVVGPALIESGCRLEEDSRPGALAFLLAWAQLGSPPLSVTGLPPELSSLQSAIPWLRKSGVLVDSVPGEASEVAISPAAAEAFKEIHRRLQMPPEDRFGKNHLPDFLCGVPEPDETTVDRIIGDATAHLLNHVHEFAGTDSKGHDGFHVVRALERALDDLDELPKGLTTNEWSSTRSVVVANLLARSDDALILPVDLKDAESELLALHGRMSDPTARKPLSGVKLGIAQLNVVSRLSTDTPGIHDSFSQVLTQLWEEFSRQPLQSHEDINTLDRLTFMCAQRLDAISDVAEFRNLVLEGVSHAVTQDFTPGRVSRTLALAGWGLGTAELSDDSELHSRTARLVQSLIDSLEESIRAAPSGGLRNLMHRLSLLHAKASWDPQETAEHLIDAWRHGTRGGETQAWREHDEVLDRILSGEAAGRVLGALLALLLTDEDDAFEEAIPPNTRWRAAAKAANIYKRQIAALPAQEQLAALDEVARYAAATWSSADDQTVFGSFFTSFMASVRDAQGEHQEVLHGLKALKESLDQALMDTPNWMILRSWLTIVSMLRERSWSPELTHSAGPALKQWTTVVKSAGGADADADAWAPFHGLELLHEVDAPLVLPGPRIFSHVPDDGQAARLRHVYEERRAKVASFAQAYGQDVTWFRMLSALESRVLHEKAALTGESVDVDEVEQIYRVLGGRQPNPISEFSVIRAKDHLASWLFAKAAKSAEPKRRSIPEHKLSELVGVRADALLRQALWDEYPGEVQRRLLETAHRELAETRYAAPGHWSSVLRLRTARGHTPSLAPQLGAVADLNALITAEESAGFLELAAALTDLGEHTSSVEMEPFVAGLETAGANVESVHQLALFHLEQAEWLCSMVPLKWRSDTDVPCFQRPSGLREEERLAASLRSAWSCFNAVVWLDANHWAGRVQSAMGQGRVLALASLVWGHGMGDVLGLGEGYTDSAEELGLKLLGFAERHSIRRGRFAAARLSEAFLRQVHHA